MRILLLTISGLFILPAVSDPLPEKTVRQAAARIDHLLVEDLRTAGLKAQDRVDDATFLRRAYLGIIGRIPTEAEAREFLENDAKERRAELVDELVASPGFDSHLFNWMADLLRLQTRQEQFGLGWHVWLRKALAEDMPWDEMVKTMLSADGHCSTDPAVGYYLRDRNMQLDNFGNTMQVFLGRQVGCAQCHDHPFDDWSQYDFYQMAAFGGGFQYRSQQAADIMNKSSMSLLKAEGRLPEKKDLVSPELAGKKPREMTPEERRRYQKQLKRQSDGERNRKRQMQKEMREMTAQLRPLFQDFNRNALFDNPSRQLKLPQDYQYKDAEPEEEVPAETLFGHRLEDVAPEDRRELFAEWASSPDNPYFTKVIVNRLWNRTFGHGLMNPVDDLNDDSETLHPEVLAYLETTMKGADYDIRQFLRVLFQTKLFQREALPEEPSMGMPLAFRGPVLTRMSAEQLFDSILVLTKGGVSDDPTTTFDRSWDAYQQSISRLIQAGPQDLLILAESAKQAEDAKRKAQSEMRAAQRALSEAETAKEKRMLQKEIAEARKRLLAARDQESPVMRRPPLVRTKEKMVRRASEHPTPFNPGTTIREFGGSDRQTPSSSQTTASVPQALALLNGNDTDIVGNRKNHLARKLLSIKSPEKRVEVLFLTLFASPPSKAELERYAGHADDPIALRDLARAMLTSNRFLFVQ